MDCYQMAFYSFKKTAGYTFSEIIVAIFIVSIVFFFAIPLSSQFINRNALDKRVNTIEHAVKFSRNQSLILNKTLVLSPLFSDNNWQKGMKLSVLSNSKEIIRQWHWHNKSLTINWKGFNVGNKLLFSNLLNQYSLSGTFELNEKEKLRRKIIINRLGRVRVEKIS